MALHTRESAATLAAVCRKMEPSLLVYDASMEALAAGIAAGYPQICAPASKPLGSAAEAQRRVQARRFHPGRSRRSALPDVPLATPAEDDPAVIVLSSGTTSVPKGVVHTHRGFIENARTNLYLYQGLLPRDRSLVPLSTAFIGCYNGWFPFLQCRRAARFSWSISISANWRAR